MKRPILLFILFTLPLQASQISEEEKKAIELERRKGPLVKQSEDAIALALSKQTPEEQEKYLTNFEGAPDFLRSAIAYKYYLLTWNYDTMPEKLKKEFTGVSINDMVLHNKVPEIKEITIRRIPHPAFRGAHLFKTKVILDLSKQYINSIKGLNKIKDINTITQLVLDKNRLSSLPVDAFEGLTSLRLLSLNNNQLRSFPTTLFDKLNKLTKVSLKGNPLGKNTKKKIKQAQAINKKRSIEKTPEWVG